MSGENHSTKKYCEKCDKQVFSPYVHCDLCFDCYHPFITIHCPRCDKCHKRQFVFCDICKKCPGSGDELDKHCKLCNTCHSIYIQYCDKCHTCHSTALKWCSQCQKCERKPCPEPSTCQTCQKQSQDCHLNCTKCGQSHCMTLQYWCQECQLCLTSSSPHCLDCKLHHRISIKPPKEKCGVCNRVHHCPYTNIYFCNTCSFCTSKHDEDFISSWTKHEDYRIISCNSCFQDIGSDCD